MEHSTPDFIIQNERYLKEYETNAEFSNAIDAMVMSNAMFCAKTIRTIFDLSKCARLYKQRLMEFANYRCPKSVNKNAPCAFNDPQ